MVFSRRQALPEVGFAGLSLHGPPPPSLQAQPLVVAQAAAADAGYGYGQEQAQQPAMQPTERMGEAARKALARATLAVKRYGWIGFWIQLTLSVVSAVILLFSVAFTSQVRCPTPIAAGDTLLAVDHWHFQGAS